MWKDGTPPKMTPTLELEMLEHVARRWISGKPTLRQPPIPLIPALYQDRPPALELIAEMAMTATMVSVIKTDVISTPGDSATRPSWDRDSPSTLRLFSPLSLRCV